MLTAKRPANGISPMKLKTLLTKDQKKRKSWSKH